MGVTYLRHPVHGEMAESSDQMVAVAKANGWEEFDPTVKAAELPSFFGGLPVVLPEGFPAREWLVKAGYETLGSVPRDLEELTRISGIGNATALKVLDALEG